MTIKEKNRGKEIIYAACLFRKHCGRPEPDNGGVYPPTDKYRESECVGIKQIEKKIDVVKADYYTDDDLFIHEVGLYKISTSVLLENPEVSRTIRKADARMMEVNPTYSTVLLAGLTPDITGLYDKLNAFGCLLQYSRSGRIAVTRSFEEPVTDFLQKQGNDGDAE